MNLAYVVKKDEGVARFDQSTRKLIINLPVKPQSPQCHISTDGNVNVSVEQESVKEDANPTSNASQEVDLTAITEKESHLLLPTYTCNVSDRLIIVKMDVENVEEESIKKKLINDDEGWGFSLKFTTLVNDLLIGLTYFEEMSHNLCKI